MAITHSFSPEIFTLIRTSELSRVHFERHPIWSEFYDCEEREEILDWGVDPEWFDALFERMHSGNEHCAYPVLRPYPLPDRMRLYIKARIRFANGASRDGFVVNDDAYVIVVFDDDREFYFTRAPLLRSDREERRPALEAAFGATLDRLLPLTYETDILGHDGELIRGVYEHAEY